MKSKLLEQIEEFLNDDENYDVKSVNTQLIVEITNADGEQCTQAFLFDCVGKYIDNYEV